MFQVGSLLRSKILDWVKVPVGRFRKPARVPIHAYHPVLSGVSVRWRHNLQTAIHRTWNSCPILTVWAQMGTGGVWPPFEKQRRERHEQFFLLASWYQIDIWHNADFSLDSVTVNYIFIAYGVTAQADLTLHTVKSHLTADKSQAARLKSIGPFRKPASHFQLSN